MHLDFISFSMRPWLQALQRRLPSFECDCRSRIDIAHHGFLVYFEEIRSIVYQEKHSEVLRAPQENS